MIDLELVVRRLTADNERLTAESAQLTKQRDAARLVVDTITAALRDAPSDAKVTHVKVTPPNEREIYLRDYAWALSGDDRWTWVAMRRFGPIT